MGLSNFISSSLKINKNKLIDFINIFMAKIKINHEIYVMCKTVQTNLFVVLEKYERTPLAVCLYCTEVQTLNIPDTICSKQVYVYLIIRDEVVNNCVHMILK